MVFKYRAEVWIEETGKFVFGDCCLFQFANEVYTYEKSAQFRLLIGEGNRG